MACCEGSLETLPFLSETKLSHHLEALSYLSLSMMATQASTGSSYIYQFLGHILLALEAATLFCNKPWELLRTYCKDSSEH